MKKIFILWLLIISISSCKQKTENAGDKIPNIVKNSRDTTETIVKEIPKPVLTYHFVKRKEWQSQKDSFAGAKHLDVLNAINRVDTTHLKRLDSIIVPDDFSKPVKDYLPFPDDVDFLKNVHKIIIFSYPAQAFAAYENGKLVLAGPTNMGRKSKPTPQRLYFTNWKAKKTRSTVDDEWILKWNFNVHNQLGVGFHEYALPGYPASHSCMRLLGADAQFLYSWADQWILKNDYERAAYGTPVIVYGKYPFGKTKPWYDLVEDGAALTISKDTLLHYIQPHLPEILEKQKLRQQVTNGSTYQ